MMIKSWRRESTSSKVFDVINVFINIILLVIFIYPFLNIIAISFSDYTSIIKGDVTIYPIGFTLESYSYVLLDKFLYYGYMNSIIYALGFTIIMLTCTSLLAYPLSLKNYVFSKFTTVFLTITIFFNGGLVPTYLLIRNLGIIDSIWVMIIPGSISAFNVFVFRTFFKSIPFDLTESAKLDGASDLRILLQVIIPLSKPLLATFALFGIVGIWNNWFSALLYLNDQKKYPLQLILRNYLFIIDNNAIQQRAGLETTANPLIQGKIDPKGVRMAMVTITMFPIMMTYPYFQKYFMKGIMIGAIKG